MRVNLVLARVDVGRSCRIRVGLFVARVRGCPRGRSHDHGRCRPMRHPQAKVHRMFELVEPIATVTFSEVPNEAFLALGMRNYWDGYFAGRAAPLGVAPAGVVHAVFYNFAEGEVARHIPWVWR